jgi:hypothetical protein
MSDKQTVSMQLPFPAMQWWGVAVGNGQNTHTGANNYAYDFYVAQAQNSEGATICASARGKVTAVVDDTSGPDGTNYVKIEHAAAEVEVPIHIKRGSATARGIKVGDTVEMGQEVAAVGDVGTSSGNYHLHFALSDESLPDGSYQTIPSQFMYYDMSTDRGETFIFIRSGTPQTGQWIRRRSLWSPWSQHRGNISRAPAVVSPSSQTVDVYARGEDDRLWQRFWDGSSWSEWFVHPDTFLLGSSPVAYSNGPNHRDIYVRGQDGAVYHKWWDGTSWNGWYGLGGQIIGEPTVVAPAPEVVDVYARGKDDRLWQNYWDGSRWSGWFVHEDSFLLASSPVAYSSGMNHRDVYVRGQDGAVYHKWWDGAVRLWHGWYGIGGQIIDAPAIVSRKPQWIDVFARGTDDRLWQTWWDGASWAAWRSHEDGFPLLSSLAVNSRGPEHVDLYAQGYDKGMWQKWWQA